jgi:hypothetical protein
MNKPKITAVVYDTEDARAFLRDRPEANEILTLTPNARVILKDSGIPIIPSTDRYTDRDHVRCVARIRRADRQLVAALEKEPALGIAAKETLRHDVRVAAATAVRLWLTLGKKGPWTIHSPSGWVQTNDRRDAFSVLNDLIAVINIRNRKRPNDTWAKPLFRLLSRLCTRYLKTKKPFLVTGYLYGLSELANRASAEGRMPLHIRAGHGRVAELSHTIQAFWRAFCAKAGARLIVYGDESEDAHKAALHVLASISDPVIRLGLTPLRKAITQGAVATQSAVAEMSTLIGILRPSSLIAHSLRWNDEAALGEAAGLSSVPRILISHGSHTAQHEPAAEDEQRLMADGLLVSSLADMALAQSPHAEAMAKRVKPDAVVRRIRPTMWGYKSLPQPNTPGNRKRILHAGTYKSIFNYRPVVYETSDEYVMGLVSLVEAVARIPDADLIIRVRPMPECDIATLRDLLPKPPNCQIKTSGSFLEDLADADLLVSFSSTTIEEALQARRPVLLWGGSQRYRHLEARTILPRADNRSAVYTPDRPEDLEPMIRAVLEAHRGKPLTNAEIKGHIWLDDDIDETLSFESLVSGRILITPSSVSPQNAPHHPAPEHAQHTATERL